MRFRVEELPGPPTVEYLHLPKIKIKPLKIIGKVVKAVGGPVGNAVVGGVEKGIEIVKGAKLQPKSIVTAAAQGAIDAAQGRVSEQLNQSTLSLAAANAQENAVPLLLIGGLVLLLFLRGKR